VSIIALNQTAPIRWHQQVARAGSWAVFWATLALAVAAILPVSTTNARAQQLAAQPPETILLNGRVLTLDATSSVVEAVAISGGRLVATGSSAEIRKVAGTATRIIDLGGRTVIPGLIDSHIHAIRAGLKFSTEASWIGATSIAEATDRIRQAALYAKPGSWIVIGGGWTPSQFAEGRRPTQSEIIAAAPDHPVYIQLFYSAAFISPAGLKALSVTGDSGLPAKATFDLDAERRPSGWISGDASAITTLYARLPKPTLDESLAGTRRFLSELNRFGVTGVIDPGGHNLAPEDYEALFRLWRSGDLSVRMAYSICAPRPGDELADLQLLTRFLPMAVGDDMLRFNGIGERVTWGLYNNDAPTEAQKVDFFRVAKWAADRGMALTAHWNNDKSVHHLLEVFERVDREVPIRALRWSVAHLHDASDASLRRMKALGVGWLMQNGLHFATANYLATRGSVINRSPPIRTALRLGLNVGGGTDAHRVMSYNPFTSLQWMIDGRTVDGMPTRAASELVTREEALRLYTHGSAWFSVDEGRRGTLEPGRLADLAVLDQDYMSVPVSEISRLQSLLTMVGGRIVHQAGAFKDLGDIGK
jgi:predicted amidohydrolase YtcJ